MYEGQGGTLAFIPFQLRGLVSAVISPRNANIKISLKSNICFRRWLLEVAKKVGVSDAGKLLVCLYIEMSTDDAKRMLKK